MQNLNRHEGDPLQRRTGLEKIRIEIDKHQAVMTPEIMIQVIDFYDLYYYRGEDDFLHHAEAWKDSWIKLAQPEWFDIWLQVLKNPSLYHQFYESSPFFDEDIKDFVEFLFVFFYDLKEIYPRDALAFTTEMMDAPNLYPILVANLFTDGHPDDIPWLITLVDDTRNLSGEEVTNLKRVLEGILTHARDKEEAQRLLQKLSQHQPTNKRHNDCPSAL